MQMHLLQVVLHLKTELSCFIILASFNRNMSPITMAVVEYAIIMS